MADFGLNEEERMVQQLAHEFAVKEIRPVAAYYDEHEELPRDVMLKANQLGLSAGMMGQGASMLVSPVVTEELSWGDSGIAFPSRRAAWRWRPLAMATEDQKKSGSPCVSSASQAGRVRLTEPEAGRRRQHFDDSCPRRRRLHPQRHEAFHHQRRHRHVHVIFATDDKSKSGAVSALQSRRDAGNVDRYRLEEDGYSASWTADVVLDDAAFRRATGLALSRALHPAPAVAAAGQSELWAPWSARGR
jgi:acyl-CoA dehydrogenase